MIVDSEWDAFEDKHDESGCECSTFRIRHTGFHPTTLGFCSIVIQVLFRIYCKSIDINSTPIHYTRSL